MNLNKITLGLLAASLLSLLRLQVLAADTDVKDAKKPADKEPGKETPEAKPSPDQGPWKESQTWKVDVAKGSRSLLFSPDGKMLTLLGQGNVQLWEVATGKTQATLTPRGKGMQTAAAYSPNGSLLATGDDNQQGGTVNLWEVGTGKLQATLATKLQGVTSLAFSPSGTILATSGFALGSFKPGGMGMPGAQVPTLGSYVKLWDVAKRKELGLLPKLRGQVQAMMFLADAKTLAIITADYQHSGVILWDIQGRKVRASYKLPVVQTVSFTRDGESFALVETEIPKPAQGQPQTPQAPAGPRENKVTLRATANGKIQQTFTSEPGTAHYLVAISPFGNQLAAVSTTGKDCVAKVWNIKTGKLTGSIKSDRGYPGSMAWNPDSKKLAMLSTKVTGGMPGVAPAAGQPGTQGTPGTAGMGGIYGQWVGVYPGYWGGYGYGWPYGGYPYGGFVAAPGVGYPWGGLYLPVYTVGFVGAIPGQEGFPGAPAVPGKPGGAAVPPGAECSVSLWELKAEEQEKATDK